MVNYDNFYSKYIFEQQNTINMKKKLQFIALLTVLWFGAITAQIQVGTGTITQSNVPINAWYGYNYSQQIYTAAEIGVGGTITGIQFYYSSGGTTNATSWDVYIGHTTQTSFSGNTSWIPLASMTNVFNGEVTYPAAGNWMTITLDTPFVYNGTDNLVVAVDENTTGFSSATYWRYTTTASARAIYYRNDTTNPDPAAPPSANGTTSSRANIIFQGLSFPNCTTPVDQPTALNFPTVTASSISGSFTAAASAPSGYLVVRSTSATPPTPVDGTTYAVGSTSLGAGTSVVANASATTFTSNALAGNTTYYYHIFSYNNAACLGGPKYNTVTPLSNSATTCPAAPATTAATTITAADFTANWTAPTNGANSYLLYVATDIGFTNVVPGYNGLNVGAVTSYTVTGLTAATNYYYRVMAVGNTCNSNYSATITVATTCQEITNYPYVEGFNSSTLPNCYNTYAASTSATQQWQPVTSDSSNGTATPSEGTHFLRMNYYSASTGYNPYYLKFPTFNLGSTIKMLVFDLWMGADSGTDSLVFQISTDNGGNWTDLQTFTANPNTTSSAAPWETGIEIYLNAYANQTVTFRLKANSNYGYGRCNIAFDNLVIQDAPTCLVPTAATTNNITDTTADWSWTTGASETQWDLEYGVAGFTLGSGTTVAAVTTNTYGISNLMPNTTYEFYVRADCGGGDWSVWSGPYAFTTLCTAVSDFALNFDANSSLPACTQKSGTAGSVSVSSSYSQSAPNTLYMFGSGATYVLPRINNAEVTTHRLKFTARSSASTTIRMGYMTDPSNPATFTMYQTINTSNSFQQFVVLPNGAPPVGSYLALQATSSSSTYMDDLVWEAIPAIPPTCVAITSPTDTQTDVNLTTSINWATQIDATGYKLYLGTAADTYDVLNGQDVGNVTTYSLNGNLNYNTTYFAKVVPYNAFGDATACAAITFTTKDGCVVPFAPANGATAVVPNPNIQWSAYIGATAYEISIGTTPGGADFLNAYNNGTSTSYAASGLDLNTVYYVTVKAVGATAVTSAVCANYSFTTKTAPQAVPYVQDFENATSEILLTGTNTNTFYIGNATHNGGSKALYISNDNGVSNAYSNNASSSAWASVEVDLTTATYVDLVFDWKAQAESGWDYGEVYINTGGADILISNSKEFAGSSVYQTKRINLNNYTGQTVTIKFKWYNDNIYGANPPLAIDNLKVIDYVEYANGNWSNISGPTAAINAFIADNITLTSDLETKDLTINAGQVVTVEPGVTLTVAGNLTNNGSIIFKSDATGTASFGTYTGAAIAGSGTVTTERYIGARRAWRMLTAPLKGTNNNSVYANWQNNGVVNPGTGVDVWGPSGTGLHAGPAYSIKKYPTQASATTWVNVTNTMTEPLFDANGNKAFTIFVTGSYSTTPTTIASGANATVLAATGALLTGDIAYANLPTDIHTYIGNPYASPLDPSALLTEATNATQFNQLWVWDPELATVGGYLVYDPIIGWSNTAASYSNTTTTMIQSGQAFFVKPAAVANFTINESHKGTMVDNGVFAKNNPIAQLRINLQQQNAGAWQPEDALVAAFYAGGDNAITAKDAQKMDKGGVNIAFTNSQERLTVEHREPATLQDVLPIQLTGMTTAATYRLVVHGQEYTGLQPYLWDTLTNAYYPIPTDGTAYEHIFTVNDVQLEQQRFQMVFNGAQLASANHTWETIKVYPNPVTNGFCKVMLPTGTTEASYEVTSQLGQKVAEGSWTGPNGQITTQNWAAGVYHLTVKVGTAVYRHKIMVQ